MLWLLYNILFIIGFILLMPRFLYRMCRRGGYAHDFMQRLAIYRDDTARRLRQGGWIWIQAVSVGEVFVAFRFIEELRRRRPDARFVLSTNTSTGHAIAARQIDERDLLIYFPLDLPLIVRRVLDAMRPCLLILVECELWPNLIRHARARGIPVALVNGRISDHSFRGYSKVRVFTQAILPAVDLLCVQSEEDGRRLQALGARGEQLRVMGSAKYEVAQKDPDGEARAADVLRQVGCRDGRQVLLGGSTWPGEETALLRIFRGLRARHAELTLVLAPRHAERTADVLKEIANAGLSVVRRSAMPSGPATPDVFLLDTTGELKNFYPHASVIFIGKSLTQHGGQNVIEPAIYGKPIVVGPNMENFPVVVRDFLQAGAIIQVPDEAGLQAAVERLLDNEGARLALGERAADLVSRKAGAVSVTADLLLPFLSGA